MIVDPEQERRYTEAGWWRDRPLDDLVREHAARRPGGTAYVEPSGVTTWAGLDRRAGAVAAALTGAGAGAGAAAGGRVALLLPDGSAFHAALLGTARAGAVAVGIDARADVAEIAHLIRQGGATTIVTLAEHEGRDTAALPGALRGQGVEPGLHVVLPGAEAGPADGAVRVFDVSGDGPDAREVPVAAPDGAAGPARGRIGPSDLWLLSPSVRTAGPPRCLMQHQNRWIHLARLAARAGRLDEADVLFSVVPAPSGFGLWSAHVAPALLGIPAVVLPRFETTAMIEMIGRERPTVLCAAAPQFRMLLRSARAGGVDLSSVRVVFTGAVPHADAAAFEERTGAAVLGFFGSEECGALSCTTLDDPKEMRLRTAGRVLPEMDVRLFDDRGADVTVTGGPGRPGGRGPLLSPGHHGDGDADREMRTESGHVLVDEPVTIDDLGYLRRAGGTSEIIIRGGRNISAQQVEEAVGAHPEVGACAVVPVPDELHGERVCAVVSTRSGCALALDELVAHLLEGGLSKELLPEHLVVLPELPRTAGGGVAKAEARRAAVERIGGAPPASTPGGHD